MHVNECSFLHDGRAKLKSTGLSKSFILRSWKNNIDMDRRWHSRFGLLLI